MRRAAESELQREEAALRRRGLLVEPEAFKRHQFQAFLPMALVLVLGRMDGGRLDGIDLDNSYNSYGSTDSGRGGDGGGGSDGGSCGGGGD